MNEINDDEHMLTEPPENAPENGPQNGPETVREEPEEKLKAFASHYHRPVTIFDHIGKWITQINAVMLVIIAIVMVAAVTWQVISRYFLATPSTYTDEIARFMFMWVGLLGAVQASAFKQHLAIDLMAMKLQGMRKIMLMVFIELCTLIFAVSVMVIGGWQLTAKTFASNQLTPSLQIPMGYIYLVVPIAGALIAFLAFADLYRAIKYPNLVAQEA